MSNLDHDKWCLRQLHTSTVIAINSDLKKVGRHPDAEICLTNFKISRHHANMFLLENGHPFIQDLNSLNGTFVNGQSIPAHSLHKLNAGDKVSFGIPDFGTVDARDKLCVFEVVPPVIACSTIDSTTTLKDEEDDDSSDVIFVEPVPIENKVFANPSTVESRSPAEIKSEVAKLEPLTDHVFNVPASGANCFSAIGDNSVVIDLTEDEERDIYCSQIYQMSQKLPVKIEPDEMYLKIKEEMAFMDFFQDEFIVNPEPIDVDVPDDGFQNTQEILDILDEPPDNIEKAPKPSKRRHSSKASKRSSLEHSPEKKQRKNSSFNPLAYNTKDMEKEFKKRRHTVTAISNDKKSDIRKQRKQKLKQLSSSPEAEQLPGVSEVAISEEISDFVAPQEVTVKERKRRVSRVLTKSVQNCDISTSHEEISSSNRTEASKQVQKKKQGAAPRQTKLINIMPDPRLKRTVSLDKESAKEVPSTSRRSLGLESMLPSPPPAAVDIAAPPKVSYSLIKNLENTMAAPALERVSRLMLNDQALIGRTNPRKMSSTHVLNVHDITGIMLKKWNSYWLFEQLDNEDSHPPVNDPPATTIPVNFQNFHHYYDVFSKLVLLESWQYLVKTVQERNENSIKARIGHLRADSDLLRMDCVWTCPERSTRPCPMYRQDDFLLVEFVMCDQERSYVVMNFALVTHTSKSARNCDNEYFTIVTRNNPLRRVNQHESVIVKSLTNIRPHMMLIKAIKSLETSPLKMMVLKPGVNDYQVQVTQSKIKHKNTLNQQQSSIVLEAASLCSGDNHGIYCIRGPPGTGKSTVIVNLIFQILLEPRTDPEPMILLVAPSNTAVDNLIKKLRDFKHSFPQSTQQTIKCVRIGPESSISKEVAGYSLSSLAEMHLRLMHRDVPEVRAAKSRGENPSEFMKKFLGKGYAYELRTCENLVIQKSNIICTTLNSCINGRLIESVNRGRIKFTCCIIDEATQCHEVETLLPIILGIDKFVLVGDPAQLNATVLSREARRLDFDQSLFTRITKNFEDHSCVRMLTDQYRMHPEICSYPNEKFYGGKLRSLGVCRFPKQIRPYLVFSCEKQNDSSDYINTDEVTLIEKLFSSILDALDKDFKFTVGIITPYNAQKDFICRSLEGTLLKAKNCKVTVNTVDSFQGGENDVVIISCVRDSSNSFLQNENRLNVALTRAKQALYIIGNNKLFKECRPLYDLKENAKRRHLFIEINQSTKMIGTLNKYLLRKL